MKAARLHIQGQPLKIEELTEPKLHDHEVLVEVRAVHVAPSARTVMSGEGGFILPSFPAVMGIDAAGVVRDMGRSVCGLAAGTHVYVNPLLACDTDAFVREGREPLADSMAFMGYFTFSEGGKALLDAYPGALAQYVKAPVRNVAPIPDAIPFEQAARLGYLGTAYGGLKRAGVGSGSTVIINGATGTIGTGAVLLARAMGAARILAVARSRDRLAELREIDPARIHVFSLEDEEVTTQIRTATGGAGAEAFLDCLPYVKTSSTLQCLYALRKGGTAVFVGGAQGDISLPYGFFVGTEIRITGSLWFRTADAVEMASMAAAGTLDLNLLQTESFSLEQVNEAVDKAAGSPGGLANIVVVP